MPPILLEEKEEELKPPLTISDDEDDWYKENFTNLAREKIIYQLKVFFSYRLFQIPSKWIFKKYGIHLTFEDCKIKSIFSEKNEIKIEFTQILKPKTFELISNSLMDFYDGIESISFDKKNSAFIFIKIEKA